MTATEVLPSPQAIDASVWVDAATRTLTARLPDQAGGYERLLWVQAWQALRRSWENGWPASGAPQVWCDLPGNRQAVLGQPANGGQLSFVVPVGTRGFAELVSRPDAYAIAVVDKGSQRFLSCRFLSRR